MRTEPVSNSLAQPVEPQPAVSAQPTDDKSGNDAQKQADEEAKRKAHEEAEAKRKAEWEAKQQQKRDAEKLALSKLDAMSDDEVLTASLKRVGDDTEKLTRRNMKECVAEHIQTLCLSDPVFARKVMHPRKSMIHCIWYINRKAREYIEQEMKDNDFPKENGVYGSDVRVLEIERADVPQEIPGRYGIYRRKVGRCPVCRHKITYKSVGRLRRYNGGNAFLTWLQWEKSGGKILPDDVIQSFCQWGVKPFGLDFIQGRMSPVQVCNYVRRQMKDLGETGPQVFTIWRDYLSMAKRLKMDTNDAIIYRVKLLRQRHDELVERCCQEDHKDPAVAVLEKFPDVDQICQSIKEKYEYADKKYAVIVPNGVLDIIVEGRRLSHCVGAQDRYWDRIQRREACILFLRRASRPNEPYYTMEIEPDGTVRQLRTLYDRQQKDVIAAKGFLTRWQQVVSKRLTSEDREMAAVSRVLREQEFEQIAAGY